MKERGICANIDALTPVNVIKINFKEKLCVVAEHKEQMHTALTTGR